MTNIEFLLECEATCRNHAANINPCADSDDKVKSGILARADQFKSCATDIEQLRSALQQIVDMPFDTRGAVMGVAGQEALMAGQDQRVHESMRVVARNALKL